MNTFLSKSVLNYAVALGAMVVALLVRWPLYPLLGDRRPYLTLFGAVAFAVWFTRWRPAALAAAVGFVAANYFLADAQAADVFDSFFLAEFVGYALSAGFIIFFGEAMHRARERAAGENEERRKAEESERRQQDLVRVTLASIGDAVISTDARGRIVYLNEVAESITGWTSGEAAGQPLENVFRIVNEQTRKTVENPATRALREGLIVGLANHTVLIGKDGAERPIDDSAAPIKDAAGGILGCVLVFRDITARRKAETALSESEERFRLLVERVTDYAIYLLDPEGRLVSWNSGAERITRYTADEIIGRHFSCFYPNDAIDDGRPMQGLDVARTTGRWADEGWRLRKGGGRFWASVIVTRLQDEQERVRGFAVIKRDLTEHRRATETLRSVVDHVVDGILTIDEQGIVQSLNPAAERLFGYRADEVLGQNVKMLMPEPYCVEHDQYIANYLTSGVAKIIGIGREVVGLRKDGSTFPMELAVSTFELDEKRHFTGIVRDITERKRTEAALKTADRRKDEFLATLAHELRNPLASLSNSLQVMQLAGSDSTTSAQALGTMERQLEHMVRLVEDLLDVARISRGKIELRKERVDLASVLQHAEETCRPLAQSLGHRLSVVLPTEPVPLYADSARLTQVFGNLLNNACKCSAPGGRISVTAERQGSEVAVSVKDTGFGISAELLPRIFEMFTQGDQASGYAPGGLGIGLTLVRQLVELHGGGVEAKSDGPDLGAEFVVRLPLAVEKEPVLVAPAPAENASATARRRILVVDDNKDSATTLAMLLKLTGHDTRLSHDGLAAVDAAEEYRPDLVLLDIGLPGLDGFEVCRRIREQPWGKEVMLVALTGWGQDEDRQKSQAAGFDRHLVKPVAHGALTKLLSEVKPSQL